MAISVPLNTTNINNFISAYPAGSEFQFLAGTYRFSTGILPRSGDKFLGMDKGGKRVSIISGARIVKNWKFNGRFWYATNQNQQGQVPSLDVCLPGYGGCIYPEDLFMNDKLKQHVLSLEEVEPGKWFFDYPNNTVYVGDNPHGKVVEISTLPSVMGQVTSGISDILVENLIIEKFAAPTGHAAIWLGSSAHGAYRWTCNACELRYNHGAGIGLDAYGKATNNFVHHNGGFGFVGAGWDMLVEGNEISYNNTCRYNPYWGAGGSKWVWTTNLTVRGNYSHHNYGIGLWTDINNKDTIYENNTVEDNWMAGIFHEISYDAIIRNNKCRRNGLEKAWPWWTAGAGIAVCDSRNVEVYDNYCENNWQEITGLDDGRNDPNAPHGPWILENFRVHDNRVVHNAHLGDGTGRCGAVTERPFSFEKNNYKSNKDLAFFNATTGFNWQGWQGMGQDPNGSFEKI